MVRRIDAVEDVDLSSERVPGTEPVDQLGEYDEYDSETAFLHQFRDRISRGWEYWRIPHEQALKDVKFAYIEQWDEFVKSKRQLAQRPSLEINYIPKFIYQVVGSIRKSKFSIHVSQKSGSNLPTRKQNGRQISHAEIMEGLCRDIENRNNAHEAYCRAAQHAAEGGFGWLRIRTDEMADDPFNVEVIIEHIADRWSVLFDPMATRDDLRDAEWAAITYQINKDEFNTRYPDHMARGARFAGAQFSSSGFNNWWSGSGSGENRRITEYYYKEAITRTVIRLFNEQNGDELVVYADVVEGVLDELMEAGYKEVERKDDFKTYKVMMVKTLSDAILEGPFEWPGIHIPIIPVFGRKVDVDGRRYFNSIHRYAHDPSRMMAYWMSSMTERIANSPKSPWLITTDQIKGNEEEWRRQTNENLPYLTYTHKVDQPAPMRQHGATVPNADAMMLGHAEASLRGSIGLDQANLGESSNETSGIAIQRRQDAGNTSILEFVDNLAASVKNVGDQLCDIMPKIISNDQARAIVLADDTTQMINLNHQIRDSESGKTFTINSIGMARYSCSVRAGPGFQSQREETVKMLTDWSTNNPDLIPVIGDLIAKYMDMPNADELARRMMKMIDPKFLTPEEKELIDNGPQEPTPQDQAMAAEAQATLAAAQAKTKEAEAKQVIADRQVEVAQIELETAKAKAAKEMADMEKDDDGEQNADEIRKLIKQVLAEEKAGVKKKPN